LSRALLRPVPQVVITGLINLWLCISGKLIPQIFLALKSWLVSTSVGIRRTRWAPLSAQLGLVLTPSVPSAILGREQQLMRMMKRILCSSDKGQDTEAGVII
jgi:hypothetical protein